MIRYWQIIKSQQHPIKFLIARILMILNLSKFFLIRKKDFTLKFFPTPVSYALWMNPTAYSNEEVFFRKYLRPNDVVIDCGANVGVLSLLASVLVGEKGRVYSIEAHPKTFNYLKENIRINNCKNCLTFNYALGDTNGKVLFSNLRSDDKNAVICDKRKAIQVEMYKLDDLISFGQIISLLKIDVEGYELFVLKGARQLLKSCDCIYFESWDQLFLKYGYKSEDLVKFLISNNFRCFRITSNDCISILPDNYNANQLENLLAVRNLNAFLDRTNFKLYED